MQDVDDGALSPYLREQADAFLTGSARLPDPAAVHATRVAARRLRSMLRVYRPLLDLAPADAATADEELRWFSGLLGGLRDRHVQRERFAAALAALPPEQVLGPVAARIDDTLLAEQRDAEERLEKAVASERYEALQELLTTWRSAPPVAEESPDALRRRSRRAGRKARRRLAEACAVGTDPELHRARKAAKRARYAAEVLRPLGRGRKQRRRAKRVQALLGELQDAVVAEATLRRVASGVPAGESGFTLGLLHERERAEAERLRGVVCGP